MKFTLFGFESGKKPEPKEELADNETRVVNLSSPLSGGYEAPTGTAIDNMIGRISTQGLSLSTRLKLYSVIRSHVPPVSTAIQLRRALEGDVSAESEDAGLLADVNHFMETVPVGYMDGPGCPCGLNHYLDLLASTGDEFGLGVGEKIYDQRGRVLERLVVPDMRTFGLSRPNEQGYQALIQKDANTGREVVIDSPNVHSLSFAAVSTDRWPAPMVWGLEFVSEILIRMFTSMNTLWLEAGTPPMMYAIQYDKEARPKKTTVTRPDGTTTEVDQAIDTYGNAIKMVKEARRRGMVGEVLLSAVGATFKNEPLNGRVGENSLANQAVDHLHAISQQVATASSVPSWLFPSGAQRGEGIGSSRSQQEAAIAIGAATKRQRKINPIGTDIIDSWLLSMGKGHFIGKYTLGFTPASIINQKLVEESRQVSAQANQALIRQSFELFNPDGENMTVSQAAYLEFYGVHIPEDAVIVPDPPAAE